MVIIMITKHYRNHTEVRQLFYLSVWFQRARPSQSSSIRTRRRRFLLLGSCLVLLSLANLGAEDTKGFFMLLSCSLPLGLCFGLLLVQLGQLCLDLLDLDGGLQFCTLSI
jgi:hypothetical protein